MNLLSSVALVTTLQWMFCFRGTNGANCAVSISRPYQVECDNVNSFRDIAGEIRSSWKNVKMSNRRDRSLAVDPIGLKHFDAKVQ